MGPNPHLAIGHRSSPRPCAARQRVEPAERERRRVAPQFPHQGSNGGMPQHELQPPQVRQEFDIIPGKGSLLVLSVVILSHRMAGLLAMADFCVLAARCAACARGAGDMMQQQYRTISNCGCGAVQPDSPTLYNTSEASPQTDEACGALPGTPRAKLGSTVKMTNPQGV